MNTYLHYNVIVILNVVVFNFAVVVSGLASMCTESLTWQPVLKPSDRCGVKK